MASGLIKRLTRITSSGNYIPEIDGFRFLAITGVVFAHVGIVFINDTQRAIHLGAGELRFAELIYRGTCGVELFFVISGFILALPFAKHFLQGAPPVSIGRYYLRRLTRLEPPYFLCLFGFYAASWFLRQSDMPRAEFAPTFFARLFYLHDLIYGHTPKLNGVTWSLEVEVQFYVLVPVLVHIFRLPTLARRGLMLALILGLPWLEFQSRTLQIALPSFLHYFIAGFLLADLYLEVLVPKPKAKVVNDLVALGLIVAMAFYPVTGVDRPKPLALMIATFYFLVFRSVLWRKLLTKPWLCVTGGMCYTIYLLHYPLLVQFDHILYKLAPSLGFFAGTAALAALALPIIAIISVIYFAFIERPCMDSRWPAKLWARLHGITPQQPAPSSSFPK